MSFVAILMQFSQTLANLGKKIATLWSRWTLNFFMTERTKLEAREARICMRSQCVVYEKKENSGLTFMKNRVVKDQCLLPLYQTCKTYRVFPR